MFGHFMCRMTSIWDEIWKSAFQNDAFRDSPLVFLLCYVNTEFIFSSPVISRKILKIKCRQLMHPEILYKRYKKAHYDMKPPNVATFYSRVE